MKAVLLSTLRAVAGRWRRRDCSATISCSCPAKCASICPIRWRARSSFRALDDFYWRYPDIEALALGANDTSICCAKAWTAWLRAWETQRRQPWWRGGSAAAGHLRFPLTCRPKVRRSMVDSSAASIFRWPATALTLEFCRGGVNCANCPLWLSVSGADVCGRTAGIDGGAIRLPLGWKKRTGGSAGGNAALRRCYDIMCAPASAVSWRRGSEC